MKTPDEIKKGLVFGCGNCMSVKSCSVDCPYEGECSPCNDDINADVPQAMLRDALAYIRQLEAERDAAVKDMYEAQSIVCLICKNHYQPDPAVKKYGCKEFGEHCIEEGAIVCGMFEWRGVQKEE